MLNEFVICFNNNVFPVVGRGIVSSHGTSYNIVVLIVDLRSTNCVLLNSFVNKKNDDYKMLQSELYYAMLFIASFKAFE